MSVSGLPANRDDARRHGDQPHRDPRPAARGGIHLAARDPRANRARLRHRRAPDPAHHRGAVSVEVAGLDRSSPGRPRACCALSPPPGRSRHRRHGGQRPRPHRRPRRDRLDEQYLPFRFDGADPGAGRLNGVLELVDRRLRWARLMPAGRPAWVRRSSASASPLPGITDDGHVTKASELEWRDVPDRRHPAERTGCPCSPRTTPTRGLRRIPPRGGTRRRERHRAGARHGHRRRDRQRGPYPPWLPFGGGRGRLPAQLHSVVLPVLHRARRHGERDRDELAPWVDRRRSPRRPPHRPRLPPHDGGGRDRRRRGRARPVTTSSTTIGLVCAAISVVLAPSVIVLAGAFAQYSELSVEQLSRRLVGRIPSPPRLVASSLGSTRLSPGSASWPSRGHASPPTSSERPNRIRAPRAPDHRTARPQRAPARRCRWEGRRPAGRE